LVVMADTDTLLIAAGRGRVRVLIKAGQRAGALSTFGGKRAAEGQQAEADFGADDAGAVATLDVRAGRAAVVRAKLVGAVALVVKVAVAGVVDHATGGAVVREDEAEARVAEDRLK